MATGSRRFRGGIANNLFGRAAELAFYFLFALFPLILLVVTLFGLFASRRIELQNDLLSHFTDFLPWAAFQLLRTVTTELAANASGGKLTFGIVLALWCVSSSISSMISYLNLAYHVREARSKMVVSISARTHVALRESNFCSSNSKTTCSPHGSFLWILSPTAYITTGTSFPSCRQGSSMAIEFMGHLILPEG